MTSAPFCDTLPALRLANPAVKITRRRFLTGLAAALGGYSTLVEPQRLTLERITAKLPGLAPSWEGLRIAVLSDFHLHPFTRLPHIQDAVNLANSLKPDLVVLLGDYVDATVEAIYELAPELASLNARLGVFGVLGNHDHWKGPKVVTEKMEAHGISMLRNRGITLPGPSGGLYLAGVDSAWNGHADLQRAMADRLGKDPAILLVHEPDFADRSAADGRVALQLSGHSHGGQVRLPGIGAMRLPSFGCRYDMGTYHLRDMMLYTNRGIGLVDLPVRFNCPPEVTEVTLSA